ncbi:hypothetical protein FRACYDRAFT_246803 [Fragilariopsis cylindrus CCMP1102]|uniref:Uncharacterized protein n=1 Tax=Fragilariopsis cylindrus CCMP1102 TaxID=635003 RepID=A0A1E7EY18_9STRA|nr:hypothetical protein FRACYDRAFT_246803 [Fragilariopsis cylindrus CCMP1102]|eukprot:OEU10928.1 hypothetical protein FRACYDRAFT_246803 [Fragilariopsis cylindrus CCMP1102]
MRTSTDIRLNRMEDDYDRNTHDDGDDPTKEEDDAIHDFENMVQEKSLSSIASGAGGTHDNHDHDHDDQNDDDYSVNEYFISVARQVSSQMKSYKEKSSYDMSEDVYSFIIVAPVFSWAFLFATYVIGVKYIVYLCLLQGIKMNEFDNAEKSATVVKFFLIPVAIAMQDDLMTVYSGLANCKYDKAVLYISESASFWKFNLSYVLRFLDGGLSLTVNFLVMLQTDDVLSVFLNFAALHFLQDIDDVFYKLVEKGFFGDSMEHMATICKQVTWPRRRGSTKSSLFLTELDTICFVLTLFILLSIYIYITVLVKRGNYHFSNTKNDTPSPSWSPSGTMNATTAPSTNF